MYVDLKYTIKAEKEEAFISYCSYNEFPNAVWLNPNVLSYTSQGRKFNTVLTGLKSRC